MKNGCLSSGKRTKHFDIRYFYVRDLIERGVITVEHCTTEDMVADFFTKPIQGKRFQDLRDLILNRKHASALQCRSVLDGSLEENIVTENVRDPTDKHSHIRDRSTNSHNTLT